MTVFYIVAFSHLIVPLIEYLKVGVTKIHQNWREKTKFLGRKNFESEKFLVPKKLPLTMLPKQTQVPQALRYHQMHFKLRGDYISLECDEVHRSSSEQ